MICYFAAADVALAAIRRTTSQMELDQKYAF
jgi:hypothetical protein